MPCSKCLLYTGWKTLDNFNMDDRCNTYFLGINICEILQLNYFALPLEERHTISNLQIFKDQLI